jgi:hypothetical protein
VCEDQEAGEETEGIAGGDSVGCNGWVGWGADDLPAVGWGSAAPHVGRYPVSWHRSVGLIRISLMPVLRSIGKLVVGSLFHADTCPACCSLSMRYPTWLRPWLSTESIRVLLIAPNDGAIGNASEEGTTWAVAKLVFSLQVDDP